MVERKTPRVALDQYPTPTWVVHRLLEHPLLDIPRTGTWFEPCAGAGQIVRAVESRRAQQGWEVDRWVTNEIDPLVTPAGASEYLVAPDMHCSDIRDWKDCYSRFAVAITNPPYMIAREVLEVCRPLAKWLVLLLRTQFLASEERAEMFRQDEPDIFLLPNRPSFTANGQTDMHDYAWFVWGPERKQEGQLCHLASTSKEERKKPKL